jgi:hypothetical protein
MNKIKSFNLFFILFFVFLIILYRDFLYTYRMQIENFLPYYHYQDQIIYYLTGDKSYDVQAPMNLRFLGLVVQYLIYQLIPCVELTGIKLVVDNMYTCATYSNALMNYFSLCATTSLMFVYTYKKIKLSLAESFICLFLSYVFIHYVEAFTLDRISILYLVLILYFLDKPKICLVLILLSCLVNEKVIFVLCGFFFIKFFIQKEKLYKSYFWINFASGLLAMLIFYFYAKVLGHGYFQSEQSGGIYNTMFSQGLDRILLMFKTKSGLSNALIPLLFAISPYVLSFFADSNINKKIKFSNFEILVPLSLVLFATGGGMEQIGRYVMYSFPIWIPILSCQFCSILKKYK